MSRDLEMAVAALALNPKQDRLLTPVAARDLIELARKSSAKTLVELLRESSNEDDLLRAIAAGLGLRYYNLYSTSQEYRLEPKLLELTEIEYLRRLSALPLVDRNGRVVVAIASPDAPTRDYLVKCFPGDLTLVLASKSQIQNKLAYFTSDLATATLESAPASPSRIVGSAPSKSAAPQTPVRAWLDAVLTRAVAAGVSDLHFSFDADHNLKLRFRIDGILRGQPVPLPGDRGNEVIGALLSKTSTMDVANRLEPQDGTFSFQAANRQVDARVTLLPQLHGPSIVIRLLDSLNVRTRLDDMGFAPETLQMLRHATAQTAGTLVVSGPTGSGKSTTLYGLLRELDAVSKGIYTVEDPVEYRLPNIQQTPIRADIGEKSLTFPRALRTILRMDPDIILVGEIRDAETAKVAMDAALTGHLVLTTLHAPSALGVYTRLREMGVPSYMVAEALTLTTAQRLARKVHDCRVLSPPSLYEAQWLEDRGLEVPDRLMHPTGCMACSDGYQGRQALVEVLAPSRQLKGLIGAGAPHEELVEAAFAGGYRTLLQDGYRQLLEGRTTVSELARILAIQE